ncbi:hypothetical protein CTAYLR_007482 [Chrysophaeum taylorii]|uniref:SET domain-containing protein n=1 Tax=Chrysophaeum taylorii TaxID=2483200 RepID=A0AAD7UBE7_9STRA|nr:hypothetical protein CTAYLR_007482 [Chrysophaeum taylorii]
MRGLGCGWSRPSQEAKRWLLLGQAARTQRAAEALSHALDAVSTRAFAINLNFEGLVVASFLPLLDWRLSILTLVLLLCRPETVALVPGADLLNHSPAPSAKVRYDMFRKQVLVVATRDAGEGDQVCLDYGATPNDRLLLTWGFVLPDNPHDERRLSRGVVLGRRGVAKTPVVVPRDLVLADLASLKAETDPRAADFRASQILLLTEYLESIRLLLP